jgi:hypothetical protein
LPSLRTAAVLQRERARRGHGHGDTAASADSRGFILLPAAVGFF